MLVLVSALGGVAEGGQKGAEPFALIALYNQSAFFQHAPGPQAGF